MQRHCGRARADPERDPQIIKRRGRAGRARERSIPDAVDRPAVRRDDPDPVCDVDLEARVVKLNDFSGREPG